MGRHTFETVKKEYLSSSIPLFLNSFWTLTLSLSFGGETRIKRSLRVVVREEEEEEEVNKEALLVNTNNDGGRNAGRLVHDDAPPMGQNEDLVVDEQESPKREMRGGDQTGEENAGKQDVFDVLRPRVAGAAIRVRELFDLHMHAMRWGIQRIWISSEECECEYVYAGRGRRVRQRRRERKREKEIFRQVRRVEISETGEQRDE